MSSRQIRRSSELPDDLGRVFVTDVPSSWFQVIGRRWNGEFFVGSCIVTPKGKPRPAEGAYPGVEVLSGPEAERLVKLIDDLDGDRIWRDALAAGIEPALERKPKAPE
jgi:hypothetical protein